MIMLLLHISDTHLGKRQYNLESRERDVYEVFQSLVDIALNERVDAVIHTGDLFDVSNPPTEAEDVAVKQLVRLKDRIPVIAIPGDHDTPKRRGKVFHEVLQDLGLLRSPSLNNPVEVKGVKFYGRKFTPLLGGPSQDALRQELSSVRPSGKSVLMLHQGVKELLPFNYSYQIALSDIPKGFTYVALGHFHTRWQVRREDGSVIAVAGSPDIYREEEIEGYKKYGKGAYLVDLSKDEPTIQKIDLNIRPQDVITVNTQRIEEDIRERSPRPVNGKLPILHLILTGAPMKKDVLMKKIASLEGKVAEKIRIYKDNTDIGRGEVKVSPVVQGSIDELIVKYLTEKEKFTKNDAELVLRMINSDDEQEIERLLEEFAGVKLDNY